MATALQDLTDRLTAVERDLAALKLQIDRLSLPTEPPNGRGARLIRDARLSQSAISAAAREAFAKMGAPETRTFTPEEVQQMMLAEGVRPEDNVFSRGIAEMREE